jgi:dephospho-CoA kinase
MRIGLTGGMGCGKSLAASFFEDLGWRRLDSDQIVRDDLLKRGPVVADIAERYGPGVLRPDGSLDRGVLAARVFGHDAELAWLENRLHPLLFEVWTSRFAAEPQVRWVVEVPLLFEKQLQKWFDFTVCVAASSDVQIRRLEERGVSKELAGKRISKQLPLAKKIDLSDFVLSNDGSQAFLFDQVKHLDRLLRDRAA